MSKQVINEIFDPFQMGTIRDKSIDSLQMYPYYPVNGKDVTNYQNNTFRIVTKGVDQHLLLSEAYLEGVVQLSMPLANLQFNIVLNTNDRFQVGAADVLVAPGTYSPDDLALALTAQTGGNATFAVVNNKIQVTVTASNLQLVSVSNPAAGAALADLLGFAPTNLLVTAPQGVGVYTADLDLFSTLPIGAAPTNVPIMHSNMMSIFRKASLYFNNVMVHQVDFPWLSDELMNLKDMSQDYVDKRKDQWLYVDATSNFDETDLTTQQKADRTQGNKWVRWQIPLKRLFPFLESYQHVIRGVEIRIELDKNNQNLSEIIMMDELANTNGVNLTYKELALWAPIVVGAPMVEANLIQEVTSKKETVVKYSDWSNYRRLNPAGSEMTWLIDNISEVPKYVYVVCQLATQVDNINVAGNLDVNPATFNNMNLVRAELRVNGHVFPKMPYDILYGESTATTADDYQRLFREWERVNYKESEYDNGSLVEYSAFKSVFPIVTFNLSREEDIQLRDQENNVLEVYLQFTEEPAQPFYSWASVEWESKMVLKSNGRQLEFTKL